MRDTNMTSRTSPVKPETTVDEAEAKATKAFSSPSTLAARMRLDHTMHFERSDQRDDGGVSVSSSSRRDPDQFNKDSNAQKTLGAIADSTAIRAPEKRSGRTPEVVSPSAPKSKRSNTLRNLADVAGLSLHDAPLQVPVEPDFAMDNNEAVNRAAASPTKATSTVASSDIDQDLVSAISKLVASKHSAASGKQPEEDDSVATLTRQIGQLAEKRRSSPIAPTPGGASMVAPTPVEAFMRRSVGPPRPTPENAVTTLSAKSHAQGANKTGSQRGTTNQGRSSQLDLMVNDNSFCVIAEIVLQPFKKEEKLSPEEFAKLDATVPAQVRQNFVDAVRYRLENNCPPGSSQHVHIVTRKCKVLGFDKLGSGNPLLSVGNTDVYTKKQATNEQKIDPPATSNVESAPDNTEAELTAAEALARQQLLAELREASNFMAESKTKEASNFWRNHVLELQARLRTLHGEKFGGNNVTDEDIMEATRRLLDDAVSSEAEASRPDTSFAESGTSMVKDSQTFSQRASSYRSSDTASSESSVEWVEGGILSKGGVMNQLAYLKNLYDLIDLLILLLEVDRLLDFLDAHKIPEKLKDAFKQMDPDVVYDYFMKNGYDKYFDAEYFDKGLENLENQIDFDKFVDDLESKMDPKQYKKFLDDSTKAFLGPSQLRESMNLDKIRTMTDPAALRSYFQQQGLDKMWDMDKLREIMDANNLREALDSNNIKETLKCQTMRDFMGDTYRGPKPMVDVVAPSNLPGGYRFEAQIDGHRFLATVPKGGVKKGETFSCLMNDIDSMYEGDIPVGGWRDRISDPLVHGVCHPILWTTVFCPLLTLAQVMTRLKYDFLGRPRTKDASPFPVMSSIIVMYFTLNIAIIVAYNFKWSQGIELSIADICAFVLVNVAMVAFSIYATASTRSAIRYKYMIREQRCYDLEDFVCATFCMPFTICQMSRHTTDYTKYEAKCCTETGLEEGAELPNTGSNVSKSNYFCADNEGERYWCADERDLV